MLSKHLSSVNLTSFELPLTKELEWFMCFSPLVSRASDSYDLEARIDNGGTEVDVSWVYSSGIMLKKLEEEWKGGSIVAHVSHCNKQARRTILDSKATKD